MTLRFYFLFLLFIPWISFSEIYSAFHLHHSGAGRASLKEDLSHILNPATLGFHRNPKSAIAYSFKGNNQNISLAFTDLKTMIPMGIVYERSWSSQFSVGDWDHIEVFVASPISRLFSMGLNIYRDSLPNKDSSSEDKKISVWNGGIGTIMRLSPQTALSVNVNHLLVYNEINNRSINLGFYQNIMKLFNLYADASYSKENKWHLKGSFELNFKKFLSLNIAHSWDVEKESGLLSGGISFQGPRLQLDYGIEKHKSQTEDLNLQHVVIVKMLF